MRVMVGVIILYDHVHPNGAFNKSSKIDVRHTHTHLYDLSSADNVTAALWTVDLFCDAAFELLRSHSDSVHVSSDERLHKSPEGPAGRQRRRPPECPQVGYNHSPVDSEGVFLCWFATIRLLLNSRYWTAISSTSLKNTVYSSILPMEVIVYFSEC